MSWHRGSQFLRHPASRLGVRLLIAILVTGAVTAAAVAGSVDYAQRQWRDVPITPIDVGVLAPEPASPDEPVNFLLVGSDSRAFVDNAEDAASFGDGAEVEGQRADAILVVRVDPNTHTAFILSIPRDTWVDLPDGHGGKINEAYNAGIGDLVTVLSTNFGIDVSHTLEINFQGVENIVNAVGGVPIYFCCPARDALTALDITQDMIGPDGFVHLDGTQALAYVRSRHFQTFENGHWVTDPRSDLGRVERQQYFLRALAQVAISAGLDAPDKVGELIQLVQDNLHRSADLDLDEAIALLRVMRSVDPADQDAVESATLPTTRWYPAPDGSDAQRWLPDQAEVFLQLLAGQRSSPEDLDPAAVTVTLVDTTASAGMTDAVAAQLAARGIPAPTVDDPGDDTVLTDGTEIRYAPHRRLEGELVQEALGGIGTLVRDDTMADDPNGVQVVVVLGPDAIEEFAPGAPTEAQAPPG